MLPGATDAFQAHRKAGPYPRRHIQRIPWPFGNSNSQLPFISRGPDGIIIFHILILFEQELNSSSLILYYFRRRTSVCQGSPAQNAKVFIFKNIQGNFFCKSSGPQDLRSTQALRYNFLLFVDTDKIVLATLSSGFWRDVIFIFVLRFILGMHSCWTLRLLYPRCSQTTQGQYLKMRIVYELIILIKKMRYQAVLLLGFLAVMATGLTLGNTFVFPDRVTLQTSTGAYLARCRNCGPANHQDSVSVHETNPNYPYAQWTLHAVGSYIALQADNGKFLAACKDCWNNATQHYGLFAFADKATDSSAMWFIQTWEGYLRSDEWAFYHPQTNGFLRPCHKCVQGGSYDDFAFAMTDYNPRDSPITHWTMKAV